MAVAAGIEGEEGARVRSGGGWERTREVFLHQLAFLELYFPFSNIREDEEDATTYQGFWPRFVRLLRWNGVTATLHQPPCNTFCVCCCKGGKNIPSTMLPILERATVVTHL